MTVKTFCDDCGNDISDQLCFSNTEKMIVSSGKWRFFIEMVEKNNLHIPRHLCFECFKKGIAKTRYESDIRRDD